MDKAGLHYAFGMVFPKSLVIRFPIHMIPTPRSSTIICVQMSNNNFPMGINKVVHNLMKTEIADAHGQFLLQYKTEFTHTQLTACPSAICAGTRGGA